jgi:uncharacterized phage-like protein YoqJ
MATACFTGHRKLGEAYYNSNSPSTEWHTLRQYMDQVVKDMIDAPYNVDHFISGLAIGVDLLAAESVAYVRVFAKGKVVKLTGAMPFPSQPNKWPESTRQHWHNVCQLCNEVVSVSADPYSPQKMQVRNEWMVDLSDYVIAVWNGEKSGGTWNCMSYALGKNKSVLAIQPIGAGWSCGWIIP